MTQRKKIVFVWNYLSWGGAQIYFLAIMKVARQDWDILVLLPKGFPPDFLTFLDDLNIEYEFLRRSLREGPADSLVQKVSRQLARVLSEYEVFRRLNKFDHRHTVIHIEAAPWQSWQLLGLLSATGAKTFITIHNFLQGGNTVRKFIWKLRMKFVSLLPGIHVFTSNNDAKERFRGWFLDDFHRGIEVTHTCVDPVQIQNVLNSESDSLRNSHAIPADRFVILSVGQFIDRKGRWTLLEAARMAIESEPDLLFLWLMPQLPDEEDAKRIESYGLRDSFRPILSSAVGITREEILTFFRVADVFALPSFVEGLPVALLEAMALGLPSVSTNVFAIPEAIKDDETGSLVPAGNARSLSNSIIRLKREPERRKMLGKAGQAFVLSNFDERVVAQKIVCAYERSLGNG